VIAILARLFCRNGGVRPHKGLGRDRRVQNGQRESALELRAFYHMGRKWAWLIVMGAALAGGGAFVASSLVTPVYEASATLRISPPNAEGMSDYSTLLAGQRLVRTYAQLLIERAVLEEVIGNLGLKVKPQDLEKRVRIETVPDTELIKIRVEHTNPAAAQAIANDIPPVFLAQDRRLQTLRYAELKANLAAKMEELEGEIRGLQEGIARQKAVGTGAEDAGLVLWQGDLEQARTNLTTLMQNYGQVELAEAQSGTSITVVAPAAQPESPIRPHRVQNTLLGVIAGALLAGVMGLVIEYLDDTLKTPDDIQAALGTATLGAICRSRDGTDLTPLALEAEPQSIEAESFRVLRTNVQFSQVDRTVRRLMVTSPGPVEGKSTVVANLAVAMAQAGQRVIVVDADLRRPQQHKLFGLDNTRGLTGALLAETPELGSWLQRTSVGNLRVMMSGILPPNPMELLGSKRMRELLARLGDEADVVVVDSPPVLAAADAAVLSRQVDGTLLLVESGGTRRGQAQEALQALEQVRAKVLGVVLNKVDIDGKGSCYYHYGSDSRLDNDGRE
jgi:succinoglycan biosynthesis transport protein ExoP